MNNQQNREEKKIVLNSGRRFGDTTKQLLEFLQYGMKGKSVVYATTKGNFLSPKAVENLIESTRQSAAKEAREEVIKMIEKISEYRCGKDYANTEECSCDWNKVNMLSTLLIKLKQDK